MRYFILLSFFLALSVMGSQAAGQDDKEAKNELLSYFFAAARINDTEVLSKFIEAGLPVNIQNHKGYSALMVATYNGQRKAFDYLMSAGANPCLQDARGNTALMAAIFRGELAIAYQLANSKCNIQQKNLAGQTAEEFARVFDQKEIFQELLAIGQANEESE